MTPPAPLASLREQVELLTELYRERANDIEVDPAPKDGLDAPAIFRQAADMMERLCALAEAAERDLKECMDVHYSITAQRDRADKQVDALQARVAALEVGLKESLAWADNSWRDDADDYHRTELRIRLDEFYGRARALLAAAAPQEGK